MKTAIADVLFASHSEWGVHPPSRPQAAGRWFLTYTVSGRGGYRQGPVDFSVGPGDLALLRRDVPNEHYVADGDRWEFIGTRFEPAADWTPPSSFGTVTDGLLRARVRRPQMQRRVEDAFSRLLADVRRRESLRGLATSRGNADDERLRRLLLHTLEEIFLLLDQDTPPLDLDHRVGEAIQAMSSRPDIPHDVETLAHVAKLSPSRFAHLFKATVGASPMRALRLMRLQQAALRLAYTNDSVTDIATQVGFGSIYDFSRQFRRQYGVSSRGYRRLRS